MEIHQSTQAHTSGRWLRSNSVAGGGSAGVWGVMPPLPEDFQRVFPQRRLSHGLREVAPARVTSGRCRRSRSSRTTAQRMAGSLRGWGGRRSALEEAHRLRGVRRAQPAGAREHDPVAVGVAGFEHLARRPLSALGVAVVRAARVASIGESRVVREPLVEVVHPAAAPAPPPRARVRGRPAPPARRPRWPTPGAAPSGPAGASRRPSRRPPRAGCRAARRARRLRRRTPPDCRSIDGSSSFAAAFRTQLTTASLLAELGVEAPFDLEPTSYALSERWQGVLAGVDRRLGTTTSRAWRCASCSTRASTRWSAWRSGTRIRSSAHTGDGGGSAGGLRGGVMGASAVPARLGIDPPRPWSPASPSLRDGRGPSQERASVD